MKIQKFNSEETWLEERKGKITGTRLKDVISKRNGEKKIGFFEILAERIAIPHNGEAYMDRGKRLEDEAMERFVKETGKKVSNELVMWIREDNENIAISPDGSIGKTEAVEIKCLSNARHLEALITKKIPDEYEYQVLQYFLVNDKLKKLWFVFYNPSIPRDLFWIEVKRSDIKDRIDELLVLEKQVLEEIEKLENELTF